MPVRLLLLPLAASAAGLDAGAGSSARAKFVFSSAWF
jgi:hypothetical protein